jgi:DNA polymerase/3'-5' exonuclease PolX
MSFFLPPVSPRKEEEAADRKRDYLLALRAQADADRARKQMEKSNGLSPGKPMISTQPFEFSAARQESVGIRGVKPSWASPSSVLRQDDNTPALESFKAALTGSSLNATELVAGVDPVKVVHKVERTVYRQLERAAQALTETHSRLLEAEKACSDVGRIKEHVVATEVAVKELQMSQSSLARVADVQAALQRIEEQMVSKSSQEVQSVVSQVHAQFQRSLAGSDRRMEEVLNQVQTMEASVASVVQTHVQNLFRESATDRESVRTAVELAESAKSTCATMSRSLDHYNDSIAAQIAIVEQRLLSEIKQKIESRSESPVARAPSVLDDSSRKISGLQSTMFEFSNDQNKLESVVASLEKRLDATESRLSRALEIIEVQNESLHQMQLAPPTAGFANPDEVLFSLKLRLERNEEDIRKCVQVVSSLSALEKKQESYVARMDSLPSAVRTSIDNAFELRVGEIKDNIKSDINSSIVEQIRSAVALELPALLTQPQHLISHDDKAGTGAAAPQRRSVSAESADLLDGPSILPNVPTDVQATIVA